MTKKFDQKRFEAFLKKEKLEFERNTLSNMSHGSYSKLYAMLEANPALIKEKDTKGRTALNRVQPPEYCVCDIIKLLRKVSAEYNEKHPARPKKKRPISPTAKNQGPQQTG